MAPLRWSSYRDRDRGGAELAGPARSCFAGHVSLATPSAKVSDQVRRWPNSSSAKVGFRPSKRLMEPFALLIVEAVDGRALMEALE